jgi:hypothetical protein
MEREEDLSQWESGQGFSPDLWGSQLWHILHMISFNFPVHPTTLDRQHYRTFFSSLAWVLPCGKCRANYSATIKQHLRMVHFQSRHTLSRFVYALHCSVKNKPLDVSYEQMRATYEKLRATDKPNRAKAVVRIVPMEPKKRIIPFHINAGCFPPRKKTTSKK